MVCGKRFNKGKRKTWPSRLTHILITVIKKRIPVLLLCTSASNFYVRVDFNSNVFLFIKFLDMNILESRPVIFVSSVRKLRTACPNIEMKTKGLVLS